MEKRDLKPNDIVQIDPAHDVVFGGCFMVVTEPKPWGAQGACIGPGYNGLGGTGIAYYRCKFENMEFVGHAEWGFAPDTEEGEEEKTNGENAKG